MSNANDISDKAVQTIERELQNKAGFKDAVVEVVPIPDYFIPMMKDPNGAAEVMYFRVTTSLGTFGIVPQESTVAIDLTELGLTCKDLRDDTAAEPEEDSFLMGVAGLPGLVWFRLKLEARKAAN